jgi:putative protease
MKDNNQSANIAALVDAGIRSFKIEGRYKDLGYVKNITAHYRTLLDELLEQRPELAHASSGHTRFNFTPDPNQNFNREFTDYFVQGRKQDIAAFDTPKNPGQAIGHVTKVGADWVELQTTAADTVLHNGDGLCYYNLHKELVGLAINQAEQGRKAQHWRVFPKDPMADFADLRPGTEINRNRDMDWMRAMERNSSQRRIPVWAQLSDTPAGLALTLTDEDGCSARADVRTAKEPAKDGAQALDHLTSQLARFGNSLFALPDPATHLSLATSQPWFVPASLLNRLRRDAVQQLEIARDRAYVRPARAAPVEPPALYPEDSLSYLANVYNHKARDFYAKHGVRLIAAAYESQEETGEVSLMITKHCVRFSLSLCPKQAKGVTGVQGTVKAEPLTLINGREKLTLRFDCKPCEMHVVGKMKTSVVNQALQAAQAAVVPMKFYQTRPQV